MAWLFEFRDGKRPGGMQPGFGGCQKGLRGSTQPKSRMSDHHDIILQITSYSFYGLVV